MEVNEKYTREVYDRINKNSMLISLKQREINILKEELEVLEYHMLNDKALMEKFVFENKN